MRTTSCPFPQPLVEDHASPVHKQWSTVTPPHVGGHIKLLQADAFGTVHTHTRNDPYEQQDIALAILGKHSTATATRPRKYIHIVTYSYTTPFNPESKYPLHMTTMGCGFSKPKSTSDVCVGCLGYICQCHGPTFPRGVSVRQEVSGEPMAWCYTHHADATECSCPMGK